LETRFCQIWVLARVWIPRDDEIDPERKRACVWSTMEVAALGRVRRLEEQVRLNPRHGQGRMIVAD
jgi:hypothetical protein